MLETEIKIVVSVMADDDVCLYFLRDGLGWIPTLVENVKTGAQSPPPECFDPTDETIDALNDAVKELVGGALAPVGRYKDPADIARDN